MPSLVLIGTFVVLLAQSDGLNATSRQTPKTAAGDAVALNDKAHTLARAGKWDEALDAARQSLQVRERLFGPRHPLVAESLDTIGYIFYLKQDLVAAEAPFARALTIRRVVSKTDHVALSQAINQLGMILAGQGRLPEAEPLMREALTLVASAQTKPEDLGVAYNNFARLLLDRGDFVAARDHFEKAERYWRRAYPTDHPRIGVVVNNLGLVSQDLGDLTKAEAFHRQALAIREKGGATLELANSLNNFATALQEQGRLAEAEPLYDRAIRLGETLPGGDAALGHALHNLAVLHLLKKDYDRAGPLYERALQLRERVLGPDHPDVATSYAASAIYLHNTGRTREAFAAQERASAIRERNLAFALEIGSEAQKERYLRLLADSIDVTLWMRSVAGISQTADRAALLTVLRRKGRLQDVMAATSRALRDKLSAAGRSDLDELARVRATIAVTVLQPRGAADARAARIKQLEARADALEVKLSGQTGLTARPLAADSLDTVQRAIPAGTVLIEFFRYRPFDPHARIVAERFGPPKYVMYALRSSGNPGWVELGDAQPIDDGIAQFRRAVSNPSRSDVADAAGALSDLLTVPLTRLAGSSARVLIAPDGDLNLLPFQALVDDRGKYLIERHRFTYLTSARDLIDRETTSRGGEPLIIGNPAFGRAASGRGLLARSFEPLPGADREASAVAALLPGARMLRGAAASEANLKTTHSPAILHIATHGFFLGGSDTSDARTRGFRPLAVRPVATGPPVFIPPLLRTGLALAGANRADRQVGEDGILTASEAALLDLGGTQLVFLSACETGLGVVSAGESVYGLRRAFAIAGARSQVMSLWKVNDAATSDFVVDFYKRATAGADRSDALREAQRAALADPNRSHPFYWAAFILSGDDGPLTGAARQ